MSSGWLWAATAAVCAGILLLSPTFLRHAAMPHPLPVQGSAIHGYAAAAWPSGPKCRRARVSSFWATRCPGTWPARGCTCSRRRTRARWYLRPTATRWPGAGSGPSRISSDRYRSTRVTRWWSPPSSADWRLQHMYRS